MASVTPTAVKERPILFSGPMVRAILGGRKTQTRRIINPQPSHGVSRCLYAKTGWAETDKDGACLCNKPVRSYWGGERLWVRETWQRVYEVDGERFTTPLANADRVFYDYAATTDCEPPRWRPSIHMPRAASRLTLEIKSVRVERLQEISEQDALAEGCPGENCYYTPGLVNLVTDDGLLPQEQYRELWEEINGPDSWAANPFVWVIEFALV
jgi:hypothetical protein